MQKSLHLKTHKYGLNFHFKSIVANVSPYLWIYLMSLAHTYGLLGPEKDLGPISQALKNKNGWHNLGQPLILDSTHPKNSTNMVRVWIGDLLGVVFSPTSPVELARAALYIKMPWATVVGMQQKSMHFCKCQKRHIILSLSPSIGLISNPHPICPHIYSMPL
jgi:hypothetical protein